VNTSIFQSKSALFSLQLGHKAAFCIPGYLQACLKHYASRLRNLLKLPQLKYLGFGNGASDFGDALIYSPKRATRVQNARFFVFIGNRVIKAARFDELHLEVGQLNPLIGSRTKASTRNKMPQSHPKICKRLSSHPFLKLGGTSIFL